MAKLNKNVVAALQAIVSTSRVTADVGKPLVEQGLIEVNTADTDASGAALARLTEKGTASLADSTKSKAAPTAGAVASSFAIITNAIPPESKRGAGRVAGPSKYPFDTLPVGGSFFVATSTEVPNPLKTLGSAVANATNKHRVDTGTKKSVTRTKRGEKAADGSKIKEQVQVPVYNYPVKFVIRGVKANQKCGEWVAPADGALITRTV